MPLFINNNRFFFKAINFNCIQNDKRLEIAAWACDSNNWYFEPKQNFAQCEANFLSQASFCAVGVIKTGNFHMINTLCKHSCVWCMWMMIHCYYPNSDKSFVWQLLNLLWICEPYSQDEKRWKNGKQIAQNIWTKHVTKSFFFTNSASKFVLCMHSSCACCMFVRAKYLYLRVCVLHMLHTMAWMNIWMKCTKKYRKNEEECFFHSLIFFILFVRHSVIVVISW